MLGISSIAVPVMYLYSTHCHHDQSSSNENYARMVKSVL